ncbi:MAG: hypothetical protein WCI74_11920 [Actinomycetes bacterium]
MGTGDSAPPPAIVDWSVPAGRKPDWLFGAGATPAEKLLVWAGSLAGAGFVGWMWRTSNPGDWSAWQYLIAALIAFDLVGGAVSNAANSTKRQYFGPLSEPATATSRLARSPVGFAALHVYPFLIVALFPGGTWLWATTVYIAMLVAVFLLDQVVPLYLQRPTAMLLFVLVALLSTVFAAPAGWGWFPIVYFAKLVLAHAVREEPYRPALGT